VTEESIKSTFMLSASAKYRLSSLKARLRRKGVVQTESGLVERLLSPGSLSALEAQLESRPARRK
jgi:hypothetical protein